MGRPKTWKFYFPKEYQAYMDARRRCLNPNDQHWPLYGQRGIKFLFESFAQFLFTLGPRPLGLSLDRKNNNGNYEPSNVRWATPSQQSNNQRKRLRDPEKYTREHINALWRAGYAKRTWKRFDKSKKVCKN